MYERVRRDSPDPDARCREFRAARDDLFRFHPQSALSAEQRATFHRLPHYDYEPSLRIIAPLEPVEAGEPIEYRLREDGVVRLHRAGRIHLSVHGIRGVLTVFWMATYGGGLFLPFKDATHADETYGGGRYVLDTVKGADHGRDGDALVVDFNYAYNPSCAYNPVWDCPLAPPENWLPIPVRAGEKRYMPSSADEAGQSGR